MHRTVWMCSELGEDEMDFIDTEETGPAKQFVLKLSTILQLARLYSLQAVVRCALVWLHGSRAHRLWQNLRITLPLHL